MQIRINGKPFEVVTNSSEMLEIWMQIFEMFAHESGHEDSMLLLYHTPLFQKEEEFTEWCLKSTGSLPPLYWVNRTYDLLKHFWVWIESKEGPLRIEFSAE